MIITVQKPFEKIEEMSKGFNKIFVVGCGECATECQTGGEEQVKAMAKKLEELGKTVTGYAIPEETCDKRVVRRDLRDSKANIENSEVILVLACGLGIQTVAEMTNKLCIPGCDTKFAGMTERIGKFYERCRLCGDCKLWETGGICPIARCPKGLLNGPCGGYMNGKCEVNKEKDCAWVLIYKRLKELGRLDEFRKFREPRDYEIITRPQEIVWASSGGAPSAPSAKSSEIPLGHKSRGTSEGGVISSLQKSLETTKFTITGELTPPKGVNISEVLNGAKLMKDDVVAVNVTDNPTSRFVMSTLATCHLIEKKVGLETVYQVTCRDRNRLALQSDIIAANALGIKNILVLTGDYITLGDHPKTKPVFDLDSVQLLWTIKRMMEEGLDIAGKKLDQPPRLYPGVAVNPGLDPLEPEVIRLEKKVEMGARFAQTQCLYDASTLEGFLNQIPNLDIKILVGITPLTSAGMAEWMVKNCPGVIVPDSMIARLKSSKNPVDEGVKMMVELVKEISTMKISGIHVMFPEKPDLVVKMVKEIRNELGLA